jgi:hypothetical protein
MSLIVNAVNDCNYQQIVMRKVHQHTRTGSQPNTTIDGCKRERNKGQNKG